jgi:hypothetical protein
MTTRNYKHLWKTLRQRFFPQPSIFLVCGAYRVAYEGGYDWTVGYCTTRAEAEDFVALLRSQLKEARQWVGPAHANERRAYAAMCEARYKDDPPRTQFLREAWHHANTACHALIDEVHASMIDQGIPFPYSHLMERRGSDGPIEYHIEEVLRCPQGDATP